jgi:hypothetical protein
VGGSIVARIHREILGEKTGRELCGALLVLLILLVHPDWHLSECAQFVLVHLSWDVRSRVFV